MNGSFSVNEMLRAALAYAEQKKSALSPAEENAGVPMIGWKPLQHKRLTSNEIIAHF